MESSKNLYHLYQGVAKWTNLQTFYNREEFIEYWHFGKLALSDRKKKKKKKKLLLRKDNPHA